MPPIPTISCPPGHPSTPAAACLDCPEASPDPPVAVRNATQKKIRYTIPPPRLASRSVGSGSPPPSGPWPLIARTIFHRA
jgi:hypothetical protein